MARKNKKSKPGVKPTTDRKSGEGDAAAKPKAKPEAKARTKGRRKKRPEKKGAAAQEAPARADDAKPAEKGRATAAEEPGQAEEAEPMDADLDAALDDLDSEETLDRLLAEASALGGSGTGAATASPRPGDDEPEVVEDLDAALEEDLSDPDARERLLAETVALAASTPEAVKEAEDPEELGRPAAPGEPTQRSERRSAPHEEPVGEVPVDGDGESESGDDDEVLDLGPVSTPEQRDRLLAAALAHAEMQEARYRVPAPDRRRLARWKGAGATFVFLVAGFVAVFPPGWATPEPPARLTAADHLQGVRMALLIQAQQIEAFRLAEKRLPLSLAEVPVRLPGVRFARSSNRLYQLIARTPEGEAVIYDSASPAPEFADMSAVWSRGVEGS